MTASNEARLKGRLRGYNYNFPAHGQRYLRKRFKDLEKEEGGRLEAARVDCLGCEDDTREGFEMQAVRYRAGTGTGLPQQGGCVRGVKGGGERERGEVRAGAKVDFREREQELMVPRKRGKGREDRECCVGVVGISMTTAAVPLQIPPVSESFSPLSTTVLFIGDLSGVVSISVVEDLTRRLRKEGTDTTPAEGGANRTTSPRTRRPIAKENGNDTYTPDGDGSPSRAACTMAFPHSIRPPYAPGTSTLFLRPPPSPSSRAEHPTEGPRVSPPRLASILREGELSIAARRRVGRSNWYISIGAESGEGVVRARIRAGKREHKRSRGPGVSGSQNRSRRRQGFERLMGRVACVRASAERSSQERVGKETRAG
ncbi:hypothetical protein C8R45DRAFT_929924 [Mycena sanguinolenta]|nr:hypothetical protein C8R45DRAFT_929924 [Mycena sanguinolenta]